MNIISVAKKRVPPTWRLKIKEWYYDFLLKVDATRGIHYEMVPPNRMNFVGGRDDFIEVGKEFLSHFQNIAGLQPHERVLDIGSGIGRMAIPLTGFLDKGTYEGFDIIPFGVKWCQERITSRFPHFRFALADINNSAYNPGGKLAPYEYRFPYERDSFDFAFATSVFTHLVEPSMIHYLKELERVLRPGGRALLTFFLLQPNSLAAIGSKTSHYFFTHPVGSLWTDNPASPEWAIAAEEKWLKQLLTSVGLELDGTPFYGSWCGTPKALTFQDVLLVRKPMQK